MKIAVILNCAAGVDDKDGIPAQVQSHFAQLGVHPELFVSDEGEQLVAFAKKAIEGGFETIVAGGGDGTVNAVGSQIVRATYGKKNVANIRFGVLPLGTLNHFAKDLNIPLKLEEAVENVCRGSGLEVDVAQVNDRVFLNNSSLGLYPKIVDDREHQQRMGAKKWPAFVRAMSRVLSRYPFIAVRIEAKKPPKDIEGKPAPKEIVRRSPLVFVGNNVYEIDGLNIGSRKSLTEGVLCLYVTRRVGRLALFWLGLRGLLGNLSTARDFDTLKAESFTIESKRSRVDVSLDGEVTQLDSPLTYKILPKALRVIVPTSRNS